MNSDWEEFERARQGEMAAWTRLVQAHYPRLVRMTMLITGSLPAAQDLAQETLVRLFKKGPRHHHGSLAGFLSTIAYRLALKEKKRASRLCNFEGLNPTAETPDPLDRVLKQERHRLIARAIRSLPTHHRDVLILRFYGESSYEEIARTLDLPLGTVKSRLFFAVKSCRDILQTQGAVL